MGKTNQKHSKTTTQGKHPHARGEDFQSLLSPPATRETPPRPWGRLNDRIPGAREHGNTPTPVGKTRGLCPPAAQIQKHPHARGEDELLGKHVAVNAETPPRPWGRRCLHGFISSSFGNTPTPVGKTLRASRSEWQREKHPHARGEDAQRSTVRLNDWETPPRPWGRLSDIAVKTLYPGNTPTPVGKTKDGTPVDPGHQKHPHARGEDGRIGQHHVIDAETPPRPWGRLSQLADCGLSAGNTPTPVGKTNKENHHRIES